MMGQGKSLIDGSPLPTWNCKPASQQCWSWVTFMTVSQEDSWTPAPQSGSFFTSQATYPVFLSGKWLSIYLINRDKAERTQDVSVLVTSEEWLIKGHKDERWENWRTLLPDLHQNALSPYHAVAHAHLYPIHQLAYSLPYSNLPQRDFPGRAFSEAFCCARPVPSLNLQCMSKVPWILWCYVISLQNA